MIRLPPDLGRVSDARLQALDAGCWRELIKWVKHLREVYPNFDQALKNGELVEDELAKRGLISPPD